MPKSWKEIRARKHGVAGLPPAGGGPGGAGSASGHLFAMAAHHFRAGNLDRAEQACRDALVFEPGHFDSLHLLGAIASRLGHHAAAAETLARALASNSNSPECHLNLGLCLVSLGHREEAAARFRTATEVAPNFVDAYICLGNLLREEQRLDDASAQYRQALALMPANALALYNLGNVFLAQDRFDEAAAQYRRALEVDPSSAPACHNLAAVLARLGQWEEAQAMYERALVLKPDDADTLNNLGNLNWQQDRGDEAVALYQRALALRPDFVDAHNNLGNVLRKQGKGGEAFACFQRALALDLDREDTHLNLCSTIYELGLADRDSAVAAARALLQAHGDKPLIRRGLSGLLNEGGAAENDSDYARALFDSFANAFDKTLAGLGYDPSVLAQALDIAGDSHCATLDVLDIGCGTGLCGALFRPAASTLVGVDVSPKMLEKARALSIYDRLACTDAAAFMEQNFGAFDLLVSGDMLPYVGDLSGLLLAACGALRARGRLAVSAESLDAVGGTEGFQLAFSGRYKHSRAYLEGAFAAAGFGIIKLIDGRLRQEANQPVGAWFVVAEKRGPI